MGKTAHARSGRHQKHQKQRLTGSQGWSWTKTGSGRFVTVPITGATPGGSSDTLASPIAACMMMVPDIMGSACG